MPRPWSRSCGRSAITTPPSASRSPLRSASPSSSTWHASGACTAAAWNTYVRAQDALAWKQALDLLDELKPAYKLAVGQKPALATTYPRLATFFDTHKNIAERASVTKKTKKKEKAAEAAAQAQATEAVSLAPSTPKSTQSLNPR